MIHQTNKGDFPKDESWKLVTIGYELGKFYRAFYDRDKYHWETEAGVTLPPYYVKDWIDIEGDPLEI